ncbi:BrnT family toxin [Archaeoglobales archaeon]|nr:MAG: BrnT family toxin [Archaeoglobales archaeon]
MQEIRLIWTEDNISHIAKHNVSVREVEEAVKDGKALILKRKKRYALIGSAWGRILFIVLEKVNSEYYVVTARDATQKEKRRYKTQ